MRRFDPSKLVDASFIKDDEHTRRVGKLQEIIYYLDEKNFKDSIEKITGLGFASDPYVADLARNIIRLSVFYKSKRPLLLRLVSEFKSKSDLVNEIELHAGYGIKVEAQSFLLSLIDSNLISDSFELKRRIQESIDKNLENAKRYKYDEHLQKVIEEDNIEELKQIFLSPDFDINQTHYFIVMSLIHRLLNELTLIEFSALCGSIACFRFLYINGANLKRLEINDYSQEEEEEFNDILVMETAIAGGNIEIMKLLEQSKIKPAPYYITTAIKFHRIEIYDWIYDQFSEKKYQMFEPYIYFNNEFIHGIHSIEKIDPQIAFDDSCKSGIVSIAKLLLSNFSLSVKEGFINACSHGCIEVLKLIISLPSFDINNYDTTKKSILSIACQNRNVEVMRLLLTIPSVDVNKRIQDDLSNSLQSYLKTPLYIACEKGYIEIVKLLLSVPSIDVNAGVFSHFLMNLRFTLHVKKDISRLSSFFSLSHQSTSTMEKYQF